MRFSLIYQDWEKGGVIFFFGKRYHDLENVPWIGRFYLNSIQPRIDRIYYKIVNIKNGTHKLNLGLTPGRFYETDYMINLALMVALFDYVEKQLRKNVKSLDDDMVYRGFHVGSSSDHETIDLYYYFKEHEEKIRNHEIEDSEIYEENIKKIFERRHKLWV